jgi:hypothetical protein
VTVSEPAGKLDTPKLAVPALVVAVPRTVPLNVKVIVSPFGMVLEVEVTVAVKVPVWPTSEGFGEELSVVVVTDLVDAVTVSCTVVVWVTDPSVPVTVSV